MRRLEGFFLDRSVTCRSLPEDQTEGKKPPKQARGDFSGSCDSDSGRGCDTAVFQKRLSALFRFNLAPSLFLMDVKLHRAGRERQEVRDRRHIEHLVRFQNKTTPLQTPDVLNRRRNASVPANRIYPGNNYQEEYTFTTKTQF